MPGPCRVTAENLALAFGWLRRRARAGWTPSPRGGRCLVMAESRPG